MLLALESSDRLCAACVLDQSTGQVVAAKTLDIGRGHAEQMMGVIENVLADANCAYHALKAVAVCVGPGSFTGIRVGVSAAIGFGIALQISPIGVTSLQALAVAQRNSDGDILCLIDANRGDVYMQTFSCEGLALDDARQISLMDVALLPAIQAKRIVGSGAALLANAYPHLNLKIAADAALPAVVDIAKAALNSHMCVAAKPFYVRRPDAKPQLSYTLARALRG